MFQYRAIKKIQFERAHKMLTIEQFRAARNENRFSFFHRRKLDERYSRERANLALFFIGNFTSFLRFRLASYACQLNLLLCLKFHPPNDISPTRLAANHTRSSQFSGGKSSCYDSSEKFKSDLCWWLAEKPSFIDDVDFVRPGIFI